MMPGNYIPIYSERWRRIPLSPLYYGAYFRLRG